jgi:anti-sigma factor RsiW
MKSNCDKMRDEIAGFIAGILPEEEEQALQQHLKECSACRDCAESFEKEEQLLRRFFAKCDANMSAREDGAIEVIGQFDTSSQSGVASVGRTIIKNFLIKHAAVAVVIVFVAVYFVITLSWISEINECIRLSM